MGCKIMKRNSVDWTVVDWTELERMFHQEGVVVNAEYVGIQ